jgi:hypothetical protein
MVNVGALCVYQMIPPRYSHYASVRADTAARP